MISVVVPAYNEEGRIGACLSSLVKERTKHQFEVIVVDNGSTDRTVSIAKKYRGKLRLRIIRQSRRGRGPARRAGFAAARGNIVLSTDADTVVPTDWIDQLVGRLADCGAVAVTGAVTSEDGSWFTNKFVGVFQPLAMHFYRIVFGHYWLSGFNFAIYKRVYMKAGGFSPTLNGFEDIDLGFRVAKLGPIVFVRRPTVVFSSRRFAKGILSGSWSYMKASIEFFLFRNHRLVLSDIR